MKQKKLWTLVIVLTTLLVTACETGAQKEQKAQADKLIESAYKARNYNRLLALADSLEQDGSLGPAKAYYWMGYASDRMKKQRMAEFYWKAALDAVGNSTDPEDLDVYAKSASRLANLLSVRGDYEGALKATIPAATRLEELECDSTSDYINLLIYIGCCQAGLGLSGETTADGFNRAYQKHVEIVEKDHTDVAYKDAIAGLINMSYACIRIEDYQHALKWIERFGALLNEFQQRPDASPDYIDKQLARFDIYQAMAYQGLGRQEEAAKAFDSFQTTDYSKTPEGRITANDYLMAAKRWEEAADNYGSLDAMMGKGAKASLEDIENLLLKKYQANVTAGRRDSAIAVSLQICNQLAPAFVQANILDKEEQNTIVRNVEKMSEQQAAAENRARMSWYALLGLLFLGFIGYTFYRRYHSRKLEEAHQQLLDSFHGIEAETAKKERTATEQRVASDIQDVLITEALPKRKDLQTFTIKEPGTMRGGDVFETMIRDEKLYICIGNASGKGPQASMLSAMATLQFRMASVYEKEPGLILAAINDAISREKNATNFVRMFIGILDLTTGELTYSNAGHNAPLMLTGDTPVKLPVDDNEPVGVQPSVIYLTQEIMTSPDTTFFFYTDGLCNIENGNKKRYGEKRMLGTALQSMKIDARPQAFVENMLDDVRRFAGDAACMNDLTLFAFRYLKG